MKRTFTKHWNDYELIDAGNQEKLERWGDIITIRPDMNAYFKAILSEKEWRNKAHFEFVESSKSSGTWQALKKGPPTKWAINFKQLTLNIELTKFKHVGIFPEQRVNWDFIADNLNDGDRFLNLFAYTGAASIAARAKGADVFHCDSVKQVISWGNENMQSSGLSDIHWIHEDALKFAQREIKRGKKYNGIVMDPPAFGIGAKKQRWKIENKFPELLAAALELKEPGGFIVINTYSPRLDEEKIRKITKELVAHEKVEVTTLSMRTTTGKTLEYGLRTIITG
ncbi:SAM-dependent methyltransferase [Pseudoalteromonas sp. NBT06-2]|uniref:class I SAM-dependent methyltransferase n=1 Tax=Pseudoalteromonas sp. NBT06-2 TaxID=2025950 RepID=UPI000BA52277|nr:class I SAM-dependent methyltransferase [Pseudoalteromonas sp. NBT06-2]PAJ71726.1 SAM-dependent methyltransferase [Pseudoalteromonas sp. NBT06-2]